MFKYLKQKVNNIVIYNMTTKNFSSNTKKRNFIAAFLLLATTAFVFNTNVPAAGQTIDELNRQKQEKQRKLDEINKKISQIQSEIRSRQGTARSLNNEIAIINLEIAETEAQIEAANGKIDATNLEIADVTEKVIQTEADIKKQKELLRQLITKINDLDQMSPLEIALENDNFTEFLDQMQYASNIQEQSQETLTAIKELKAALEIKESELKKYKSDLDALRQQLEVAEAGLAGQRQGKQEILNQTKGQEKAYQKLLAEQKVLEEDISREIYNLEVALRAKLGNNRIPAKKGLLRWPITGTMTQGYGNTGFTRLGYNFHNGIDVSGGAGTRIYSVGDGTVQDVGSGEGAYGNWVTIRHNVGGGKALISLYAHMSSFKVKKGQAVKEGELIGFEGNTGNTTRLIYGPHRGYHLHFTLFDASTYGVSKGTYSNIYGTYYVPFGATYNPLDFL